jgi:hypothetical protein
VGCVGNFAILVKFGQNLSNNNKNYGKTKIY